MAKPIIKWVGGKSAISDKILERLPKFNRYFEPFVGSGAIFFRLQPVNAVLVDSNTELINYYNVVKNNLDELIDAIKEHQWGNKEYYYQVRALDRSDDFKDLSEIKRASRFYYLVMAGFNGLYRVNQKGQCNTPYGGDRNLSIDILNLERCAYALKFVDVYCGDYTIIEGSLENSDFVYLDPPYYPVSDTASFTAYTRHDFKGCSQLSLKEFCDDLTKKDVKFLMSNSDCIFTRDLYADYTIDTITTRRLIAANGNNRGKITELLIRNY